MPIAKGKLSMPELELQLANRTDSDRISVGMHIKQWLLEMFYQFLVYMQIRSLCPRVELVDTPDTATTPIMTRWSTDKATWARRSLVAPAV
jgi:hypothetical protein